jgi:hypothetical protein
MNISVIIPIHEYNDKLSVFASTAIETVIEQEKVDTLPKIYIVHPPAIKEGIVGLRDSLIRKHQEKINHESFVLVENDGDTDFQSQINLGVSQVDTKYFSILELDDEYSKTYFFNMLKHINYYESDEVERDIDIYLSMIVETNTENVTLKLTNEVVWAQQFVGENGEMGFLNQNALKQYTDFKLSGSVINKDEFENLGGLKKNIKLTFNYEFLLRALNNACEIFVMPKIGYKHTSGREGSLFEDYKVNMPMNERNFWFETATRESNFPTDRVIDMSKMNKIVVEE